MYINLLNISKIRENCFIYYRGLFVIYREGGVFLYPAPGSSPLGEGIYLNKLINQTTIVNIPIYIISILIIIPNHCYLYI
jgi:hypothetical protein